MLTDDEILTTVKTYLDDLPPGWILSTTSLVTNLFNFEVDKPRAFALLKREATRSLAVFATRGPEEPFTRFHHKGTRRPWQWHSAREPNDEYESKRQPRPRGPAGQAYDSLTIRLDRLETALGEILAIVKGR